MDDDASLRERKRTATREALRRAALRLAMQRGWDQVRVEGIAAAAGVSTQAFNNYLADKDDAFLATAHRQAARVKRALLARPSSEPVWTAVINAIGEAFQTPRSDVDDLVSMQSTPSLATEQLKMYPVIERVLAEGIAERIADDVGRDLYPHLLARVVVTTARIASEYRLRTDQHLPYLPMLQVALEQVAAGLADQSDRRPQR